MDLKSILIVDDDPNVLSAIKRALRKEPYMQFYTDSGKNALDLLEKETVSVILCDLAMPNMDGTTLLKIIKEKYPHIIRLIISGKRDVDEILEAINAGYIFRYIVKPWNNEDLKIFIRQAIDLYRLHQEKRDLLAQLEASNQFLEKRVDTRTKQLLANRQSSEIGKHTAQIVHNLNNPLTCILGLLELSKNFISQKDPDLKKIKHFIEEARLGALDLTEIISSIMQHSRNEKTSEPGEINVNTIINSELKLFEMNPLFKNQIKLNVNLSESLPKMVGAPIQIKQIVDNLIKNAIDAMENSKEKILGIKTENKDNKIIITITDTGEGIPAKNLSKIFSPDFTTRPIGKGTGLGLASVKTMVESYQGNIKITSEKKMGATAIVELPVNSDLIEMR